MALTLNNYTGFETAGLEEAGSVYNSPDPTETTTVRTGGRSLKMTNAANKSFELEVDSIVADAGNGWVGGTGFYSTDVTPSGGDVTLLACGADQLAVKLESDGDLRVEDNTGTTLFTATTPLSTSTWHYLELYVSGWATSGITVTLFVDDTQVGTSSSANTGATAGSGFYLCRTNAGTTNLDADIFFDDAYICTGATAATERLGSGFKVEKYQNANTTATGDAGALGNAATAAATGTWDNAAETPASDTNLITFADNPSGGSADSAAISNSNTILGVKGIWRAVRGTGSGTVHSVVLGDDNDGNSPPATTVSLTTSAADYFVLRETSLPASTDKIRQGGWTSGAQDLVIYEQWAMLAYVEASGTTDGVGTAAGTSTASGTGQSTAKTTATAAGTSTASATGQSEAQATATSAGTSTASGVGASVVASVGTSAGTSTAAGVGKAFQSGAGTSAGTSTVSGTGQSFATGAGSSAGTSTAAAIGQSTATSAGTAAGTSTASAVGDNAAGGFAEGVGTSAGTSTASGVAASIAKSTASSAGASTVSGTGQSTATSAGTSAGTSTASGVSKAIFASVGTSSGTSTASAVGEDAAASPVEGVGTAAGTSTASATGAATVTSAGTATGTATATATGVSTATSAGTSAGTATASGVTFTVTILAGAGTASGVAVVTGQGTTTDTNGWQPDFTDSTAWSAEAANDGTWTDSTDDTATWTDSANASATWTDTTDDTSTWSAA